MVSTYGELRKLLEEENAKWMPDEEIGDEEKLPEYALGSNKENPALTEEVEEVDMSY